MDEVKEDRRKEKEYVEMLFCNERHKNVDERWEKIDQTLGELKRIAGKINGLMYGILGGLIVSIILLLLNLIIESQKIPKVKL